VKESEKNETQRTVEFLGGSTRGWRVQFVLGRQSTGRRGDHKGKDHEKSVQKTGGEPMHLEDSTSTLRRSSSNL